MSIEVERQLEEGKRLFGKRRFEESLAVFRQVVQVDPGRALAHYGLGMALLRLDRADEAEASFRTTLSINPEDPHSHYQLGAIAERRGRWDAAAQAYRRSIAIDPAHGARDRLRQLAAAGHLRAQSSSDQEAHSMSGQEQFSSQQPENQIGVAFNPAVIGIVRQFQQRTEADPNQPMLRNFDRPSITVVNFVLERVDGSPVAVELRGAGLVGTPPRNGDRLAIPGSRIRNGRYEITQVQHLSTGEIVEMRPLGHRARLRTYGIYASVAWGVVALTAVIIFIFFVVVPRVNELIQEQQQQQGQQQQEQQRQEQEWQQQQQEAERQRRESWQEVVRQQQEWRQELERRAQVGQRQWREDCLRQVPNGIDPSFCNR